MVSEQAIEILMLMLEVDDSRGIPSALLKKAERIEDLIRRAKPVGNLYSTQIMAMIVEDWNTSDEPL